MVFRAEDVAGRPRHVHLRSCRERPILRAVLSLAFALVSCAGNPAQPTDLVSADSLARALENQGATVVRGETIPRSSYPFFSVAAQRLAVNGDDVQVFAYGESPSADADAARVSPTGTPIGQSQVTWMDVPHFYKHDRLIVLYVGHSASVLSVLQSVLGPPFAAG